MTADSLPTRPFAGRALRAAVLVLGCAVPAALGAQVRERPVAFDSAGRISSITPPAAARMGLTAPTWPVSGDYLDARLYALDDASGSYVLVARRPKEVLERYGVTPAARDAIAHAIGVSLMEARLHAGADTMPTIISEPVRGLFVLNQTLLGLMLFGPAAATLVSNPDGSVASYLLVSGASFFFATDLTRSNSVSRAQNHLSWHSARRGALAADLLTYAVAGDADSRVYAGAALVGGIAGDVLGFNLAKPMSDAEAHGTSHGSTVTAALAAGALGTLGLYDNAAGSRMAFAGIVGAGALGYPLGLSYARNTQYTVTAGDIGTLVPAELIGVGAAATLVGDGKISHNVVYGALTAGFATGALLGDRLLVRPFDYTDSESRLLELGTFAGALMGSALPVLARAHDNRVIYGSLTLGGLAGAIVTHNLIEPQRSGEAKSVRTGAVPSASRFSFHLSPESALLVATKLPGRHSLLSVDF